MKYGLLINRRCLNLGDDIQSYAESLFLPQIDYLVDREFINKFKPKEEDELVATIMGAWWSFRKWNFPPSKNILPLWTSMHITDFTPEDGGVPVYDEFLHGLGADYMRQYAPVGTRDDATLKIMKKNNIPAYFSGCVTLTLPKQRKIKHEKDYILLVDLDPKVESQLKAELKGKDIEIKRISNIRSSRRTPEQMDDWEFRKKETIELLELYQNAKCVVTRRLHASLPCLAMEVPVLCVYDPNESRFSPYNKWLHMVSPQEFLKRNYDYDFLNPKPNKKTYLKYRNRLIEQLTEFVESAKKDSRKAADIKPIYSESEYFVWRDKLMEDTLDKWVTDSQVISGRLSRLTSSNEDLKEEHVLLKRRYDELHKDHARLQAQFYYRVRRKAGRFLRAIKVKK